MDRHNQEIEHIREMTFMLGAHVEVKTMRYKVPTVEETLNNPEFKDWCKKKKEVDR